MNLQGLVIAFAVVFPHVYSSSVNSGNMVCSADIPGLCSHDFDVINSTFGIILPAQSHEAPSVFENDIIYKMVQPLPYGSAGMVSTQSNGTLHFVSAMWFFRSAAVQNPIPSTSLINSVIHGQLLVNGTSSQVQSAFALQSPPRAQPLPCSIRVSPFYLSTKKQVTAYARLQGCQIIKTTKQTTVNFFRTEAAPVYTDATMQSAIFPLDSTMKTGSVVIDNIDAIRTSTESYNAALDALQLD